MRLSFVVLLSATLLASQYAAGQRVRNDLDGDCVPSVASVPKDFSFFPDDFKLEGPDGLQAVEIEIAEDFRVEYGSNFKVVTNLRVDETYVLYQCGTSAPDMSQFREGAKLFEIPLTGVSVADTTFIGFMELLGVEDRAAFASTFATSPCFQKLASEECGLVAADPNSQFADESLIAAQEGGVDAIVSSVASPNPKTFAFTATADPSVLKRAEWVKFVAVFFNLETKANQVFNEAKDVWESLKAAPNAEGPVVAWMNFQDFATPEVVVSFADFKVEYIRTAGGRTLDPAAFDEADWEEIPNGFKSKTLEQGLASLAELLEGVDVVVDETFTPDNAAYTLDTFKETFGIADGDQFPFLDNKKVFRLDGRVNKGPFGDGLEWFELPVARPDLVLKDLLDALGSEEADPSHTRLWLRNIAEEEEVSVVTSAECGEKVVDCAFETDVICPTVLATCDDTLEFRAPSSNICPLPQCSNN